jgi:sigma-B regulation protein RsbU (phosphoserine phosphatase)
MATPSPDNRLALLEAENRRLRQAVEELSIINEVATAVSSTSPLDQVVELIVQKCVKHLKVDQGAVLLFEKQEEAAALRTMVRKVQTNLRTIPYRLGDQITGWMLKNQQPLVINDFQSDGRFRLPAEAAADVRSLLCVPLRLKGRMIGVLSVFNKRGQEEGFSDNDQRLLAIIGAQSAQVIENARLYEEEKALQRMQQEVQMAREIQTRLLPKSPPVVPGFDIAGKSVPAQNVGGDYFDFLSFRDGRLGLCLADVSGKGISASLLMANVQATVRGQGALGNSAAQCLHRSNEQLFQSTDTDKYVTLFYAVLDAAKRELQYSNAGHNPPWLIKANNQPTLLKIGGPVLGILPEALFEEATVSLDVGDLLLIYSDGYSEAMNRLFEEFGEDRLLEIAQGNRNATAAELIQRIGEAVHQHCAGAPQTDDMTMIVVRVTG